MLVKLFISLGISSSLSMLVGMAYMTMSKTPVESGWQIFAAIYAVMTLLIFGIVCWKSKKR